MPEEEKFLTTKVIRCIPNIPRVTVDAEVPRREYDLIEFLKKVKEEKDIVGVTIDYDNHIISFSVVNKE